VKKLLKYLLVHPLYVLLLVLLFAVASAAFLAASGAGTRLLGQVAQRLVDGLQLEGVDGALVRGVSVRYLRWQDKGINVEASDVAMQNEVDVAVLPTLRVEQLHVGKLVVRLDETASRESAPAGVQAILLPFRVDAQQVTVGNVEVWQGKRQLAQLQDVALSGQARDGVISLELGRLKGKLDSYPLDVTGKGEWDGKRLAVQALDARVGDNRLQAHGQATDKLKVEWQLDAPKLEQLYPKLHGNAKGKGSLAGLPDGTQLQLMVQELSGKLEGYDLQAKGVLDWGKQKLAAQDVVIQSGDNRLDISGQASVPFDLHWKVDAKNLANAWKGLAGNLQGEGILKGNPDKPQVQAKLQGKGLRYQDYSLGALDVQVAQEGERYSIKGLLQSLKSGSSEIKSANIDGQGSIENHKLTAQIVHAEGKADFSANGGWKNNRWQGSVQNLSLRDTPAGNWAMAGTANLNVSATEFSSSEVCLAGKGMKACGKPAWTQRNGFSVNGSLQQVPLVMLRPWLPDNISLPGNASADYQFEQRGGKPVGKLALRLPDSSIVLRDSKGKVENLPYTNARANVDLNDRRANVQAQLDVVNRGTLRADGRVDLSPQDGRHRIDATVKLNVPDISWLEKLSAQIDQLQGQVTGDIKVSGLLSQPAVNGVMHLGNGQVHLPEAGVMLDAISLDMQSSGGERAVITGSARAGNGVLKASGALSLAKLPQWQAEVSLQGNNLKLMDTHEVQALVSPDLKFSVSPGRVDVTGRLLIPESTISLREIPQTASTVSEDVVIVGRRAARQQKTAAVREAPLDIYPNVSIELGDKVKFVGFGLDANLQGKLQILRNRQDIVAQGVLGTNNGFYKAYGQKLTIERGRLLFNGALDNPGLDVRAVREVEQGDIKVGIALAGTVRQPESTLFSTPQQTQSDTLSYLLTGRAMSGVSGEQSSLLIGAVTQLGVTGGEGLVQQLGGSLGLDELGIKSNNGNFSQSEVALGKRLGPRLYVRYIVSLFDSLQQVALTYQVNKRLQIEAKSGVHQGIDLIYKVDTNKGPLGP
jgi:translocation and assembly module TamB